MHKLKIINQKLFLDNLQITGIKEYFLHHDVEDLPVLTLTLVLDPELFVDEAGDNTCCNLGEGGK